MIGTPSGRVEYCLYRKKPELTEHANMYVIIEIQSPNNDNYQKEYYNENPKKRNQFSNCIYFQT